MHNGEVGPNGVDWDGPPRLTTCSVQIFDFNKIKRALQASLPEELFLCPSGYSGGSRFDSTSLETRLTIPPDSEWAFMVFLSKVNIAAACIAIPTDKNSTAQRPSCPLVQPHRTERSHDGDDQVSQSPIEECWRRQLCFQRFEIRAYELTQSSPSLLNFVVTDGETVIATRSADSLIYESCVLINGSDTSALALLKPRACSSPPGLRSTSINKEVFTA